MTTETLIRHAEDSIECVCGNTPDASGFIVTDLDGTVREGMYGPTPEWDNDTMACLECGRVFSWDTLIVSGRIDSDALQAAFDANIEAVHA